MRESTSLKSKKHLSWPSTTVERQWVQRRGRLLRKCPEIGKTHSEIHDFIALPPNMDNEESDYRALVRSELRRVQEFARLARNAGRPNGSLGNHRPPRNHCLFVIGGHFATKRSKNS